MLHARWCSEAFTEIRHLSRRWIPGAPRWTALTTVMERAIPESGARQRWTTEQTRALTALLIQHVGYLHLHGHALAMARHVFRQACLKVNPATAPQFFCEVLNNGGSIQYGLGSAVEEARRFGVLLLPPCVNHSSDRFKVEDTAGAARGVIGAIRVPLTAIRGMGPEGAQHILAVRAAFGEFTSLLDFFRKVDRRLVTRHDGRADVRRSGNAATIRTWSARVRQ